MIEELKLPRKKIEQKIENYKLRIEKHNEQIQTLIANKKVMVKEINKLNEILQCQTEPERLHIIQKYEKVQKRRMVSDELAELLKTDTYEIGSYKLDVSRRILTNSTKIVKLTYHEADLLIVFAANINCFLERDFILNTIWHAANYRNSRSMDVYVCKLRKIFSQDSNIIIQNTHGEGFIMRLLNT